MMDFDAGLAWVLEKEGGYANHPADPGEETNYGITKRTARAHGYKGSMRAIPMDVVKRIYRTGFWDACSLDMLPDHPLRLAVFDAAVHSGPGQSVKWLQEAIGVKINGRVGASTLLALGGKDLDKLALRSYSVALRSCKACVPGASSKTVGPSVSRTCVTRLSGSHQV